MSDLPGLRLKRVVDYLHTHLPGATDTLRFELIAGGRSNITYRIWSGPRSWVLRRPPLAHVLATAHDMAREFRVLRAVAGSAVPVARPLLLCEDPAVNDAPFYVMEDRAGIVLADAIPDGFAATAADRGRIGDTLIDTMVALHAIDYAAVGLSDFGRPDGYLARQVQRWSMQWAGNKTSDVPEIDTLIRRLAAALPVSPPPTLVHGDFRLGNMALDPNDPGHVIAVYDWEMATLGDPLADLGYTLIYWAEPGESDLSGGWMPSVTAVPGFARRAELIARYAAQSGRDVSAIDFYQVLALYKLAVISEGIYKRFSIGQQVGGAAVRVTVELAQRALAIAATSTDPRLRG